MLLTVYTTTNKKLKDPTARRLENFWWHVWGSDRRALSGRALARIFEDISVGPTFVPLRGPANRWEGSDVRFMASIKAISSKCFLSFASLTKYHRLPHSQWK